MFQAVSISIFALVNLIELCFIFRLISARSRLVHPTYKLQYSLVLQTLHNTAHLCSTALVPLAASLLSYSIRKTTTTEAFPEVTDIDNSLASADAVSYTILAFNIISTSEVLGMALFQSLFARDKGLRSVTFWGANSWLPHIAKALVCAVGQANFTLLPLVLQPRDDP